MRHTLLVCFVSIGTIVQAQTPQLWGTTTHGGASGKGTIFRMDLDGSDFQVVYSFDSISGSAPQGGLCLAPNGKLYGLTNSDGANGVGTLFSISHSTLQFTKLADLAFGEAAYPWGSMMLASDGYLYGTGIGDAFRLDPATDAVTFNIAPYGVTEGLVEGNGGIYGTDAYGGTNGDGSIFVLEPSNLTSVEVYSFEETTGQRPYGKLCQAVNGKLYGMTYEGGTNGDGVLYEFNPSTNAFDVLLDFNGANGTNPWSCMISIGADKLLGSVTLGGPNGTGALFELQPSTGTYEVVHSFSSMTDGSLLFGGIIQATNDLVYGAATSGGSSGVGTVYSYDPVSHAFNTLHHFEGGVSGTGPSAELTYVGAFVGMDDPGAIAGGMKIYPVPADDHVFVSMNDPLLPEARLTLSDMTGRTIWQGIARSSVQRVELNGPAGMYWLACEQNGQRTGQRVVKR